MSLAHPQRIAGLNLSATHNDLISEIKNGVYEAVPERLFHIYNKNLQKGIRGVFKAETADRRQIDYLYKFDANAARFAAYKAHYVGNVLRKALNKNPEAFEKNAKAILKAFNRFQVTEYNTLVARCRTAMQLLQFSKNKDFYPNLEWIMTSSATPREQHLALVGTILPIDHPFWQENQPGNLYNCKCDWRQTNKPATGHPKSVAPAKGLEGNPFGTREIYTDRHPYITKAVDTTEVERFVEKHVFTQFETIKEFENGGKYLVHPLVDRKACDFTDLKTIAKRFAEQGKTAYIIPAIDKKGLLYNYLFRAKGAHINKCPDLLVNGNLFEFESFTGKFKLAKIGNMISVGIIQSDRIIIDLRKSKKRIRDIKDNIIQRVKNGQDIKEVLGLMHDESLSTIYP